MAKWEENMYKEVKLKEEKGGVKEENAEEQVEGMEEAGGKR